MRPLLPRGQHPVWADHFLIYTQRYDNIHQPQGNVDCTIGMCALKLAMHSSGEIFGNVFPLDQIRSYTHLIPHFGEVADAHLMHTNSLHVAQSLWLNNYFDKEFYYTVSLWLLYICRQSCRTLCNHDSHVSYVICLTQQFSLLVLSSSFQMIQLWSSEPANSWTPLPTQVYRPPSQTLCFYSVYLDSLDFWSIIVQAYYLLPIAPSQVQACLRLMLSSSTPHALDYWYPSPHNAANYLYSSMLMSVHSPTCAYGPGGSHFWKMASCPKSHPASASSMMSSSCLNPTSMTSACALKVVLASAGILKHKHCHNAQLEATDTQPHHLSQMWAPYHWTHPSMRCHMCSYLTKGPWHQGVYIALTSALLFSRIVQEPSWPSSHPSCKCDVPLLVGEFRCSRLSCTNTIDRLSLPHAHPGFGQSVWWFSIWPSWNRCIRQLPCGRSVVWQSVSGKTKSIKALGVQIGRFVLVFCCDETFDFQAMGQIFVSLCQVGVLGCFDEFNR